MAELMWISTAERSQSLDRRATHEYGIPVRVLMERAGLAVFDAIRELLPEGGRVAVFCGKGNNGGDGFVVARLLHEAGYYVECLVAATEGDLTPDAYDQMRVTRAQNVEPIFADDARFERRLACMGRFDLVVDALLGTGASGEVKGCIAKAIEAINRSGVPVVAVDVPSGIHCDTGEELGESIWALRTVTMGVPKPFLFQGRGLEHAGYWTVAEIGFPQALLNEPTDCRLLDPAYVENLIPERLRSSHKGENGSVLVVAGSDRMPGAAILAAKAALRSGAGMVTVASVPSVCQAVAANLPEAILLPLPAEDGAIRPDAVETILAEQHRYHAALFGPGMTHGEPVLEFLGRLWPQWERPSVIDADALNSVAQGVPLPIPECVLTPHPGEMSRLLHSSIAEVQADRFQTVRQAVAEIGHTILLKGPFSIVGREGEPMMVNCTGNPGMASAGMGDVLGGVIATLLAQHVPPYAAAAVGMYWHGVAGDQAAGDVGMVGYTAGEVADRLPKARATIAEGCRGKIERP
ncbi:MAG: NAD(P)H-hydrate dehydratase [Fimbriimonadaceae bacterium]